MTTENSISYTCPGCLNKQGDIYMEQAQLYSKDEPHYYGYQCPMCYYGLGVELLMKCGGFRFPNSGERTYLLTLAPDGGAASILTSDDNYIDLVGDVVIGFVEAKSKEDALRLALDYIPEEIIEPEWHRTPELSGVQAFKLN